MATISGMQPIMDIRPLIDMVGLEQVIKQVGLPRVLDQIGPKRLLEEKGLDWILTTLSPEQLAELKKRLP